MASLTTTDISAIAKDEILDNIFNIPTDDNAVEISPVEGYSEIKMLSSPFGAAMLSPNSEIIHNINYIVSSPDTNSTTTTTTTGGTTAAGNDTDNNIPQWKKDLIQRRKINIARTIGANQSVTCPKKGFLEALELTSKYQKQEIDTKTTSTIKTPSPVSSNLFILQSPNNSKKSNNSINSNSLDDSNSSEYLEINLHGSRYQNLNNDDLNISINNKPANNYLKTAIKVQHKQQSNYEYDNKDINNDDDDDDNNDDIDYIEMPVSTGGQYTINNIKNINKSGNTIQNSSENYQQQQQQQTTSQINNIKNNFSTPIPKQRNCLIKKNSPTTGETSLLTTQSNKSSNNNATNLSNNSSLCSETGTTSNILNISENSISSSDEKKQELNVSSSSSSNTSSALFATSCSSNSNQLHSKHDTINLLSTTIIASSSSSSTISNELIKTVGFENNSNLINKKCGIGIITSPTTLLNKNLIINSNKLTNNNNNKYIKNIQNSSNINHQKIKIKKMVSAQDINDSATGTTTVTANCQTQSPAILLDDNDSTLSQFNDFDSSEELQYGPGIVSKLRVRYLSLALRQTNVKQRTHLDNLRRATSLNNLLDGGGSTGSTNDGSIIDGDIDNELNQQNHHQQQQILNHITQNNQQQNKIHKNVSWLNENDQQLKQNSNNLIQNYIKEQEYLNCSDNNGTGDNDDIENIKEFDIEKNNGGKFLYEKNYNKKPENFYNNKTGINNNYQQNNVHIQQKQRNGRQIKRGNDSLKRARSVEALLCEKSSWFNNNNKNSNSICGKMNISSGNCGGEVLLVTETSESNEINLIGIDNNNKNLLNQHKLNTDITIEDKIINARDRLHYTEKQLSPPKRLTSIIDDTERPPPDLVKQTLKLFEATANRRNGRSLSRNTNNQVAVKIANYKSIISQEKPTISYPKPPLSPKRNNNNATANNIVVINKKPNTLDLKATKTNNVLVNKSSSPISSPVSNLTKKFSGIENNETDSNNKYKSLPITNQQLSSSPTTQPPQILPRNNLLRNSNDNLISSQQPQRTPDLIPRKHFDNLNHQNISTDSPVTQLTKKLNCLNLQNSPVTTSPTTTDGYNNKNQFTTNSIDELTNDTDSITSDDDPDGCNGGDIMIKRISKTALENISKAGTTQHFSFNNNCNKNDQLNSSTPAKQIGIIRPLVAELKNDNLSIISGDGSSSSSGANNIDNIKPQRDNLVISNLSQNKNQFNNNNNTSKIKFIDNHSSSAIDKPALTTREIEKNLINEKKNELANLETNDGNCSTTSSPPIWQLNKKIKIGSNSGQPIETQNNIMVFNFQDRKDVPDYIENDGLLIKRRRELPKPNESGFVLLGDLTLETSTDPDESWTMGPPSPCNVEFENANIIIDGKSNLRSRSKEVSLRVQFDDTLTSTFEYPSESSFLDDSVVPTVETFSNTIDSLEHIDADEIIEIPNATATVTGLQSQSITTSTGQKSLGNMSLGSAPLGSYTPIKAQIQTNFELGITRVPNNSNQMNGNSLNDKQQLNGTSNELINDGNNVEHKIENQITTDTTNNDIAAIENITEPESLQYLKPATDDLTVVYSEGTQKADLLY